MKIRLLSDLHFEGGVDKRLFENNGEDVLVLAGDIHVGEVETWRILKQFAENQEHIVYVMGNHEVYKHNFQDFEHRMQDWCAYTNIHFLNPGSAIIGDVTFIGGALWTNFADNMASKQLVPDMITDFRLARQYHNGPLVTADFYCAKYEEHAAFIKEAYSKINGKKVIVSHFLPDRACIDPQYQGDNLINDYFANNLGEWIADLSDVPYWMFGHTHSNVDLMIGDTRMLANPYGYGKNREYKECIVDV